MHLRNLARIEELSRLKGAKYPKSVILFAVYFTVAFPFHIATSKRSWPNTALIRIT